MMKSSLEISSTKQMIQCSVERPEVQTSNRSKHKNLYVLCSIIIAKIVALEKKTANLL